MTPWLLRFWYSDKHPLKYFLYPFHLLLCFIVKARKFYYVNFKSQKADIPVIIVGNITIGGTGKSPLVIHLAEGLMLAGYKVGVLSRGYGGNASTYPLEVTSDSASEVVGDEPLMIKEQTKARVVVDPKRSRGVRYGQQQCHCDVVICDDGLQHYGLNRDIEILVVDGSRYFGNGLLMPFGPLRESISRANTVDAVVINSGSDKRVPGNANPFFMKLENACFVSLNDSSDSVTVNDFCKRFKHPNERIHSVAGIGNPERFFEQLQGLGLKTINHSFADHHHFETADFNNMQGTIIMTEKDAVKCRSFAIKNAWYLKVKAQLTPSITEYCLERLKQVNREK